MSEDPVPIRRALDRLLGGMGAPPSGALATLFERWSELAGHPLAEHLTPAAIDGATLVVTVDDPLWATEARWRQSQIVGRCADLLGEGIVTRIEVRVRRPGSA